MKTSRSLHIAFAAIALVAASLNSEPATAATTAKTEPVAFASFSPAPALTLRDRLAGQGTAQRPGGIEHPLRLRHVPGEVKSPIPWPIQTALCGAPARPPAFPPGLATAPHYLHA